MVTAGVDRTIRSWDIKSGVELWRIASNAVVRSLTFSHDDDLIGGEDGVADVIDVEARSTIAELADGTGAIHSVAYIGAFIVTATSSGASIWLDGKRIKSFDRGRPISATRIISEDADFAIINAGSGVQMARFGGAGVVCDKLFTELVYSEALSVDDKQIAVGFDSGISTYLKYARRESCI